MRLPWVTHGMCSAAGCVVPCVWSRFMSADGVVLPRFCRERVVGLNRTASNLRLNLDYATLWCHPRSARPALGRDMMTRVSRRWFEAFYCTAGGLEPHGFGPIGGIHASETCVKGFTSRRSRGETFGRPKRCEDVTPRPNPRRFEITSLANQHPEPAAAQGHALGIARIVIPYPQHRNRISHHPW